MTRTLWPLDLNSDLQNYTEHILKAIIGTIQLLSLSLCLRQDYFLYRLTTTALLNTVNELNVTSLQFLI